MPRRWIVGIDGSDGSLAALRWAAAHATRAGVCLTAVRAFHVPHLLRVLAAKRGFDVDRLALEAEARHTLDEALDSLGEDAAGIQSLAIEGQPGATLLEAAEDASLLVVGRRGAGGLRQHVLGSVSHRCATHAGVPVVVVPTGWDGVPFRSVAVGFDGSANAGAAVRWALDAAPDDVPVTLVMAIELVPWLSEDVTRARFPEEVRSEERWISEAADAVDPDRRAVRRLLLHGPRQALADAAGTADLVVVGARGRGRIGAALLGSVSSWLVHQAGTPVVVVPETIGED